MNTNRASEYSRLWLAVLLVFGALAQAGCSSMTPSQERDEMLKTRDETLSELYVREPGTEATVKAAKGYATLKGFSLHPGLGSLAIGRVVIVDNATGKPTFDKIWRFALGPGFAVKSYRGVLVINSAEAMRKMIDEPWSWMALVEASFRFGSFGGSLADAVVTGDTDAYYWTETGFALEAAAGITHVYHANELN